MTPRIVTLLPAATEIVCALGLRGRLVGRSHCCDFPGDVDALPALTRARVDATRTSGALDAEVRRVRAQALPLYDLDERRLSALAPDVVVTQEACDVCAVSYEQVADAIRRASVAAKIVSLQPSRLADVVDDVGRVALSCGVRARGEELAASLAARLRAAGGPPATRSRVALVEWLEPLMLAGHWVPEAVEAAGGAYVGPPPGAPSPCVSWEELRGLRPEAVVVAPCGFDLARTRAEAAPFEGRLRALAPRVLLMDGNAYWNRPGPRLVDAVEALAEWLRRPAPGAYSDDGPARD
ncbi:MAG TPA: ABC transporter substrate-binding protein [Vicinamibacteria bacterium]|nr:ABC transporter substrate-binding protein [Vicinamibacteria bacterium]